jgi:hypothetical protein
VIGTVASGWQFQGAGDYNADGTTDILWRNTANGQVTSWLLGNGHIVGGGVIGTAGSAWSPTMGASPAAALSASGGSLIATTTSALIPEGLDGGAVGGKDAWMAQSAPASIASPVWIMGSDGGLILTQSASPAPRDSLADAVVPDLVYRDPSGPDRLLAPDYRPSLATIDPRGLGHS